MTTSSPPPAAGATAPADKKPKIYQVTQADLGQEFIAIYRNTIFTRGVFHRYKKGVWEPVPPSLINRYVWGLMEGQATKGACRPTYSMLVGVVHYLEAHLFVNEKEVDAHPDLINLQNGSYDLRQQMLLPHNPTDYLTTQLPFAYDSAAKCPTWLYWLQSSLTLPQPLDKVHDPEIATFLQEAMGYSLTTDISYHVWFWCYGRGANGKGVLFHVLEALGGTLATTLNVNLLKRDRYQLANLAGKSIALCAEANSSDNVVEDGDVKALVAGDKMTVRQIYDRPFDLFPQAKLWWSMNKLPVVVDTSDGFWRRLLVVPFNRSFELHERQRDLVSRLLEELPGIFNWTMQGLQRLMVNGQFSIPQQVIKKTVEYQDESNTVKMFVEERCTQNDLASVASSALYVAYTLWCRNNGYKSYSSRSFKNEMETLHFYAVRRSAGVFFKGVDLLV